MVLVSVQAHCVQLSRWGCELCAWLRGTVSWTGCGQGLHVWCVCWAGVLWVCVSRVGWAWQAGPGPHDLVLEVVDDQREVDVHDLAAMGHQQLHGEDVTLMLQGVPHHVLAGRREPTRMERGQSA